MTITTGEVEPQEYWDVDLIIEGALDWSSTFYDKGEMNEWAKGYQEAGENLRVRTEIYIMHHAHPVLSEDEECQCAQYLTDHHPTYSWNPVPDPAAQEG